VEALTPNQSFEPTARDSWALEAVLKILSQPFQQDMACFGLSHSVNFYRQYRINPGYDDNHIYPHECNGKLVVP